MRILRHRVGVVTSGASYCFASEDAALREARMHDAPRGAAEYTYQDRTVFLAWSGEGTEQRHYGRGGHLVGVVTP